MEWKLSDERKAQYDGILKNVQDLETTIGSSSYRLQKLLDMRKDMDTYLKNWWEGLITEMNLEKNKDYMITREGTVKDISRPASGSAAVPLEASRVGTNAAELK